MGNNLSINVQVAEPINFIVIIGRMLHRGACHSKIMVFRNNIKISTEVQKVVGAHYYVRK